MVYVMLGNKAPRRNGLRGPHLIAVAPPLFLRILPLEMSACTTARSQLV